MPTLTSYWPTGGGTFGSPFRTVSYPTREEILSEKPNDIVFSPLGSDGFLTDPIVDFVPILQDWAETEWKVMKHGAYSSQIVAFQHLVRRLCRKALFTTTPQIHFSDTEGDSYHADVTLPRILLGTRSTKPLSLLTLLHELGHHFYGESELQACRFSVWLFRAAFPRSYAKLEWDGHTLKRPSLG